MLLIPYEARTYSPSIKDAVVRGILWGSILSLGAMTKMSFFYFIVLIVPILFVIRLRHGGLAECFCGAYRICLLVSTSRYLFASMGATRLGQREGIILWSTSQVSSIRPLLQFLAQYYSRIAGLGASFVLAAAAIIYLVI